MTSTLSTLPPGGPRPHPSHKLAEDMSAPVPYCQRCNVFVTELDIFSECADEVALRKRTADLIGRGSLLDRVKLSREASAIERCHQLPHLMRYSVGHHSHDVVSLVILSWKAAHEGELPRPELIAAAHFHDHPERVWGDVPSPVKDLMGGALDMSEAAVLSKLGIDVSLTEEELEYLDGSDRVELYLWAVEEVLRGNQAAQTFVDARWESFKKRPLPQVLDQLVVAVNQYGLGRLPGDLTREWGDRP